MLTWMRNAKRPAYPFFSRRFAMLTLHLPRRFEQISKSLKDTDPDAWIVLAVAGGLLVLILAVTFLR